jgi:flagellum-specific ATP synthase
MPLKLYTANMTTSTLHYHLEPSPQALAQRSPEQVGRLVNVVGLVLEVDGLDAKLGDLCHIGRHHVGLPPLPAEVVGFRERRLLLMPLGDCAGLSPGCLVHNTHGPLRLPVGALLKGRVLDALGNPLDDRPYSLKHCPKVNVALGEAPHPLKRQSIDTILPVGVRAVDSLLTLGQGQRVGIFAGSGVGKSTLMGMIARNAKVDINVIALIGERGREVQEFIHEALGEQGLRQSIVIVATSDQPALLKIKAALAATAIAEYYREQGLQVLLMMDSLTRVAYALRDVGLAVGEPPTTRGYTPSVFAFMPKLLERAGAGTSGAITGLYTVLVDGDDMNEPVADQVRGLLDGHWVLSRDLAQKGHFPALDVGQSVSRLFTTLATPEHQLAARHMREVWALYQQNEDLMSIGAYAAGQNAKLDSAVRLKPRLDDFLRQAVTEPSPWESTLQQLASWQPQ